jgi:hypothetical protein
VNFRRHTVNQPTRKCVNKKDRDGDKSGDRDKSSDKDGDTQAAVGASSRGEMVETAADLDSEPETSVEEQVPVPYQWQESTATQGL